MNFDPAIVAWQVFQRVQASTELGVDLAAAVAAQERFSSGAGDEASEAYRELVAIGARNPEAVAFAEFLVYTTWSHLMDETVAEHFHRGLELCRALLQRDAGGDDVRVTRLRAMEQSFRSGLGEKVEDVMDFDADILKGGD
jgi:hypothetical protein